MLRIAMEIQHTSKDPGYVGQRQTLTTLLNLRCDASHVIPDVIHSFICPRHSLS